MLLWTMAVATIVYLMDLMEAYYTVLVNSFHKLFTTFAMYNQS